MKQPASSVGTSRGAAAPSDRYRIRAVDRALSALAVLLKADESLTATEIAERIGLVPSTTFRLLVTLELHRFLERESETGRYRLGIACLELGSRYLAANDIRARALPVLETLRDEFGETVHLTTLDGSEVVYLEKLEGLHPIGFMSSRVGGRAPAYCTGVGKAMLAYVPEEELRDHLPDRLHRFTGNTITDLDLLLEDLAVVRDRGYATDNQEHEEGVKCVAVPLFDHRGIAGAISLSGPAERMDEHLHLKDLATRLQEEAHRISIQLGGHLLESRRDDRTGGSSET